MPILAPILAVLLLGLVFLTGGIFPASQLASVATYSTPGAVAFYSFDESSGSALDESGNGNTATLVGAASRVSGKSGTALSLDGATRYANGGSGTTVDNLPSVTFSAWVYPNTSPYGPQGTLAIKGHGSPGLLYEGWMVDFSSDNPSRLDFTAAFSGGNLVKRAIGSAFTMNEWQYVTVTWDGTANASGVKLYRNGVEVTYTIEQSGSGSRVDDGGRNLLIGANSYTNALFNGVMDEARLYGRVLSVAEFQSDMNAVSGSPNPPPPPPPPSTTDTTPPTTPTGLTVTAISSIQINLSWNASTDAAGVTGYRIYRGGTLLTTVTGISYSNTGLTASTNYSYTVQAYDAAGNNSAQTASVSGTTQAAGGSTGTYTTTFPLTENPISEGGRWLGGLTNALIFKNVRTTPGRAFASGINNGYDDSLAILNSPSISNDHYVEVTAYLEPGYVAPSSHEIELLLRGNLTSTGPNYAPLYEILIPSSGSGSIFYQEGWMGGFQEIPTSYHNYIPIQTGDVIRAQIIGSAISVFVNGVLTMTANDSRLPTGKPGIGFFVRPGGIPENWSISRASFGAAGTASPPPSPVPPPTPVPPPPPPTPTPPTPVPPPPPPTGGSTVLGTLAGSMSPGTFVELTGMTNWNGGGALNPAGCGGGNVITQYANTAVWNPIARRFQFSGSPHAGCGGTNEKAVYYDDVANSWGQLPTPPGSGNDPRHSYGHNALNPATGEMYYTHYNSHALLRLNSGGTSWSTLASRTGSVQCCRSQAWFPDRGTLIHYDGDWGGREYNPSTNAWIQRWQGNGGDGSGLPQFTGAGYNVVALYSARCHCVILAGGSNFRKMNSDGSFTALTQSGGPGSLTIGPDASSLVVDPATGFLIVISQGGVVRQFDPGTTNASTGAWTTLSVTAPSFFNGGGSVSESLISAPVSTYGVVMYVKHDDSSTGRVYLYKHSASTPPPAPPPPPSDTTPPTVSITSPVNNASFTANQSVTLSANATDASGITSVQFLVDGTSIATDTTSPYSTTWTSTQGSHTILARATDSAGNTAQHSVTVTVTAPPPPPPTPPTPPPSGSNNADFAARCAGSGVLRCIDFDTPAWIPNRSATNLDRGYNFGLLTGKNASIDTSVRASGAGSLRHVFNAGGSNAEVLNYFAHFLPCPNAGDNPTNCTQPFPTGELNTGDEIYIQWRARYSDAMLNDANFLNSSGAPIPNSGFKIADLGFADLPTCNANLPDSTNCPTTCPAQGFELVVTGGRDKNTVESYVNCAGPDYTFRGLNYTSDGGNTWSLQNKIPGCTSANGYSGCRKAAANEWLTFKLYVKMGNFNQFNNEVKLWMGREGQPLEKLVDCSVAEPLKCSFQFGGPSIANNGVIFNRTSGNYQIGKFYLLPYMTNLATVVEQATVWYDELIFSRQDIADPSTGSVSPTPVPPPVTPTPPTPPPPASDTTPPTITITSPVSGVSFLAGQPITISASASDTSGIQSVQFLLDGVSLTTDTTSPYSTTWTSTQGAHTILARATDSAGNTAQASISVTGTLPPASTKFIITDRIQTTATLNIRATANTTGTLLGTQPTNTLGTITSGPTSQGGFNWWQVNFDSGVDGYAAEDYMVKYVAPNPTPTPPAPVPPPASGSSLSTLANSLSAGQWGELTAMNGWDSGAILSPAVLGCTSGDYITQYADKAGWDPINQKMYFVGQAHGNCYGGEFLIYTASTNTWSWGPYPPGVCQSGTASSPCFSHGYQHSTVDPTSGDFYYRQSFGTKVFRYRSGAWTQLPSPNTASSQCCGALEFFPDMNRLMYLDGDWGGWAYNPNTNAWTQLFRTNGNDGSSLPQYPMSSTALFAVYNPVDKVILFGGGSNAYKLTSAGTVTAIAAPPVSLGSSVTVTTMDPVSGRMTVLSGSSMYQYNTPSNTWSQISTTLPSTLTALDGVHDGLIATPISNYGVTMFVKYNFSNSKVYLYKNTSGGGSSPVPPPVTPPPPASDTTPPTVTITAPVNGVSFLTGQSITISASASDTSGIQSVQFLLDGVSLTTDTTSPYSTTWTSTQGAHTILARATDSAGNTAQASITVTGTLPPASTKFIITDRIQTTATLNIRATANTTGTLLGTQPTNTLGTITSGPTSQGGFNWWQVNFDSGADGYAVEDYMVKYVAPTPSPSPNPGPATDFTTRCGAPGVLKCVSFDSSADIAGRWGNVSGIFPGSFPIILDTAMKSSGASSMKFTVPSNSGSGASGSYFTNFSDNLSTLFGEGEEFYIQWRQRFSPEFISNTNLYTGGTSWKQSIIGQGDRAGVCDPAHPTVATCPGSCTQLEIVTTNGYNRNFPHMYHSCGGKDDKYEGLEYWDTTRGNVTLQNAVGCIYGTGGQGWPNCVKYKPDQWMTFQVHVKIGTWYKNDGNYRQDSTIQLWVAEEGQPSTMVIDFSPGFGHGYDIANTDTASPMPEYGKIWLLPYMTGKDATQSHPEAYTWYDDLVISRNKIADPSTGGGTTPSPTPVPPPVTPPPPASDTTPPTVTITAPVNGVSFLTGQSITISASASDTSGIQSVQFLLDGVSLTTDTTSPYSTTWTSTQGAHTILARATDSAGNTAQASISVTGTLPPASTKFIITDRIQTTATLNIRATANTTGTLLGTQPTNTLGTITSGPTSQGGFNWWQVNFDSGVDGYAAEDYMVKYVAPNPTPTPPAPVPPPVTPTPPTTPPPATPPPAQPQPAQSSGGGGGSTSPTPSPTSPSPTPSSGGGGGGSAPSPAPATPTPSPSGGGGGGGGGGTGIPVVPPTPKPRPSSLLTKPLRLGSTDSEVKTLQQHLVAEGLLSSISGVFDQATLLALQSFQKKEGIVSFGTPDSTGYGAVGPSTRAKLNAKIAKPVTTTTKVTPITITRVLYKGLKSPEVTLLQTYLIQKGLLSSDSATGFFGTLTEAAVKKLQATWNLEPVGSVGPKTRQYLREGR